MEQTRVDEVEALRTELAQASKIAQRAAVDVDALSSRVANTGSEDALRQQIEALALRIEDTDALDGLREELEALSARLQDSGSADMLRREFQEQMQTQLVEARGASQRSLDEARAHLEVRLDSLAAGFEAQIGSVRDGLWDRVAELQQRIQASEQTLGGRTASIEGAVTAARDQVATLRSELHSLTTTLARADALRSEQSTGLIGWVCHEVVAIVSGVAVATWSIGRYAVGAARSAAQ